MTKLNYFKTLKSFLYNLWFIPSDAIIRSCEHQIWKRIQFANPSLTIGCGDGRYDKMLFENSIFDYAIDITKKDVLEAKKSRIYKNVQLADAKKMPFKNNAFAAVIANSTLEHIREDKKAIKEISRVLKRGGMFYFTTTSDFLKNELLNIMNSGKEFQKFNKRMNHFHYRSYSDWKKILESGGFKIMKHSYYMNLKSLRNWYHLFKLFTIKLADRELWSYLKDSKYSKYIPGVFMGELEYWIVRRIVSFNRSDKGVWQFISAKKI